ncbi:MAG TPA: VWA domain-containing protein [Casimicrobiaceae bacterium]|nr:VWA domain-containing protein [Casimicrobiaceae bacterium]
MKFLWPEFLLLLALVPVLTVAYLWLLKRRKRLAVRYANLSLVKEALGRGPGWRRHVPPALFLLGLTALLLAVARPTAVITLPSQHKTVILAMDVSGSMRAADVEPNRLTASQVAAKAFVADQPANARIGVVSFAGTAALVQPPTQNKEDIYAAIDRFQLQRATAIGSGIIVSLAAIFPDAGIDIGQLTYGRDRASSSLDQQQKKKQEVKPVPPGSYESAVIILLTDGQRTTGPDPLDAAKMAADRGVRVYTVGVGTPQGEVIGFEGWSMRVRLDEETLKQIAQITHAEYFYAGTAVDLKKIYENLNSRLVLEKRDTEISALFAALGALFSVIAAALSVFWFHRIL